MKKIFSLFLIAAFLMVFVSGTPASAKKKKKRAGKYYRYVRKTYPLYHQMFVSPEIANNDDAAKIEQTLKDQGMPYIKYNFDKKCFIIQYGANSITAVDIMQTLKNMGYIVSAID